MSESKRLEQCPSGTEQRVAEREINLQNGASNALKVRFYIRALFSVIALSLVAIFVFDQTIDDADYKKLTEVRTQIPQINIDKHLREAELLATKAISDHAEELALFIDAR